MDEFMNKAIKLAEKAYEKQEIPVGAVIVCNGKIISKAFNKREKKHDILAHAEILAIKKASKKLKTWKLDQCDLYVTLKPCSMCESVIFQSRIRNVYYLIDKNVQKKEYYKTNFEKYEMPNDYATLLSKFFSNKRVKK